MQEEADDYVRPNRHGGSKRIDWKAAVHSGNCGLGVNDAINNYFITWEEDGWEDSGIEASARGDSNSEDRDGDAGAGVGNSGDGSGSGDGGAAARGGRGGRGTAQGGRGGRAAARGPGAGAAREARGGTANGSAASGSNSHGEGGEGEGNAGAGAGAGDAGGSGDDESDGGTGSGGTGGDGDGTGMSAGKLEARIKRVVHAHVTPHVGHRVWTDRGLSTMASMQGLHDGGYGATTTMQLNRLGLPRRFIQLMKTQKCKRGCKHEVGAINCVVGCWCVLHKGPWELVLFRGTKDTVVAVVSNCTSSTRVFEMGRTLSKRFMQMIQPEPLALFNLIGRGPTDGGDQQRKRLSLAARRQKRMGPKGALSDAEILFSSNGTAVAEHLRGKRVTAWDFVLEFYRDVIDDVSMRRRVTAELQPLQDALADDNPSLAVAVTRAQAHEHELMSFHAEGKRKRKAGEGEQEEGERVDLRGKCCMHPGCPAGLPQRSEWWCPGCHAYYHVPCFWKRHCVALKEA